MVVGTQKKPHLLVFVHCLFLIGAACLSLVPPAQAGELFTVGGVEVGVRAASSTEAREVALEHGQRAALGRLLRRLTQTADHARLPDPLAARLGDYVKGVEIQSEKASDVRYLATLSVSFDAERIRQLLRQRGISYAETESKPVLVLPVLMSGSGPLLWEPDNLWFNAWAERPLPDGLVPFMLPLGDLLDMSALSAEAALSANHTALDNIAARYDAGSVLVAVARLREAGSDAAPAGGAGASPRPKIVDLSGGWYGAALPDQTIVDRIEGAPGQTNANLLLGAANRLASYIDQRWKERNLLRFGTDEQILAFVPLQALSNWITVRDRLADVAFVKNSQLIAMSRTEAQVLLTYLGDREQLEVALAQKDLSLTRKQNWWVLAADGADR